MLIKELPDKPADMHSLGVPVLRGVHSVSYTHLTLPTNREV